MKDITGEKTTYLITQKKLKENEEEFVEYNNYSGSFSTSSYIDSATRFDEKEQAVELAQLQNKMAEILSKEFQYDVVEETLTRVKVELNEDGEDTPEGDDTEDEVEDEDGDDVVDEEEEDDGDGEED